MAKVNDLKYENLEELSWEPDSRLDSMKKLFDYAIGYATKATDWYFSKRKWKRLWGYVFRVSAVVAGAAAGVIPVIGEMYKVGEVPMIKPAWATCALAAAALLVLLDKLGGFTSGWVRYILAGQQIARKMEDFKFDWEQLRIQLTGAHPTNEQAIDAINRCRSFAMETDSIVQKETQLWAAEFQSTIKEIDNVVKAVRQSEGSVDDKKDKKKGDKK
ncbi:MAG: SLATT domain-containing protein [Deltaproteobacteria bacterium]|nr:SLATT domain-containing protein [Deltaproteobacteria bacterium]